MCLDLVLERYIAVIFASDFVVGACSFRLLLVFAVVCSVLILRLSLRNECVHTDLMNQVQITYSTVTVIAVLSQKNKGKKKHFTGLSGLFY